MVDFALASIRSKAVAAGKARLFSCCGRVAPVLLTVCPTTNLLRLGDPEVQVAMRPRLSIAVGSDGPDPRAHSSLTANAGARSNAKHAALLVSLRQVFVEIGSPLPAPDGEDGYVTHFPVPAHDLRRIDLVVPGLSVAGGLPTFCDTTALTPLTASG